MDQWLFQCCSVIGQISVGVLGCYFCRFRIWDLHLGNCFFGVVSLRKFLRTSFMVYVFLL